jgi:hypothetical protein
VLEIFCTGRKPEGFQVERKGIGAAVYLPVRRSSNGRVSMTRSQTFSRTVLRTHLLAYWRHCLLNKGFVCADVGLHMGSHDLRVFPQIALESFALPSTLGLDDIKGDTMKKGLEGGPNVNVVT